LSIPIVTLNDDLKIIAQVSKNRDSVHVKHR